MVAVPALTGVILPEALTDAILGAEDFQEMVDPGCAVAFRVTGLFKVLNIRFFLCLILRKAP